MSRSRDPVMMVSVPAGDFVMGSDHHYPEERPAHRRRVKALTIDAQPVTNARFAAFVAETGHRTLAETPVNPAEYPGIPIEMLAPASLVFTPSCGPVPLSDPRQWWRVVPGADWRHPLGPGSSIEGLEDHPVVHVGFADALAYARWAGKTLPTEVQWEYAARSDAGAEYAWGDTLEPEGRHMANLWQGAFPHRNSRDDGFERTSPVGSYPANAWGLFDMIGNVWEWTLDTYQKDHAGPPPTSCCGASPRASAHEFKVLKGGSHLCTPDYCRRYRPAARLPQATDTTASHIGFRCCMEAAP